jgi:hypothetical protein
MLINAWDPCQQCFFFGGGWGRKFAKFPPEKHDLDLYTKDFAWRKLPKFARFQRLKKIQIARFL